MTVTAQTSVVPAFRKALRRVLEDRPGLQGVVVTLGAPWPADVPEWVWIGDVVEHEKRPAGQRPAAHSYEEEFVCQVRLSVLASNEPDHEAVTDRAYALLAELEDALADDLTVGGSVRNGWVLLAGCTLSERGPSGEALERESLLTARLRVRARLAGGGT